MWNAWEDVHHWFNNIDSILGKSQLLSIKMYPWNQPFCTEKKLQFHATNKIFSSPINSIFFMNDMNLWMTHWTVFFKYLFTHFSLDLDLRYLLPVSAPCLLSSHTGQWQTMTQVCRAHPGDCASVLFSEKALLRLIEWFSSSNSWCIIPYLLNMLGRLISKTDAIFLPFKFHSPSIFKKIQSSV